MFFIILQYINKTKTDIMTTFKNTTMTDIVAKTSFKWDSLEADLLLTGMNCGLTFIKSYKMAKELSK
jgi:hypothetical protein|tara:strand:- start:25 stop:225 length:201 start_codon:yes stop_codon:yes gene_type:complete